MVAFFIATLKTCPSTTYNYRYKRFDFGSLVITHCNLLILMNNNPAFHFCYIIGNVLKLAL